MVRTTSATGTAPPTLPAGTSGQDPADHGPRTRARHGETVHRRRVERRRRHHRRDWPGQYQADRSRHRNPHRGKRRRNLTGQRPRPMPTVRPLGDKHLWLPPRHQCERSRTVQVPGTRRPIGAPPPIDGWQRRGIGAADLPSWSAPSRCRPLRLEGAPPSHHPRSRRRQRREGSQQGGRVPELSAPRSAP